MNFAKIIAVRTVLLMILVIFAVSARSQSLVVPCHTISFIAGVPHEREYYVILQGVYNLADYHLVTWTSEVKLNGSDSISYFAEILPPGVTQTGYYPREFAPAGAFQWSWELTTYNSNNSVSSISLDRNTLPPDGESTTQAHATTSNGQSVKWKLEGLNGKGTLGCWINPNTGLIRAGREIGTVVVKVQGACGYSTTLLHINCGDCTSCNGDVGAGSGGTSNGSVELRVNVGSSLNGRSAGTLVLNQSFPGSILYAPAGLDYSVQTQDVEVFRDSGVLRQIKSSDALTDIVTISPYKYEIRSYPVANAGDKQGGFYQPTGTPNVVWTVEDPDQLANQYQRVRITQTIQGNNNVSDFVWNAQALGWTLTKGNGLRSESMAVTADSNGDRVETREVKDGQGHTASKKSTTLHLFPWGYGIVKEVLDPDGAALTSTNTWYTDAAFPGRFAQLQSISNADGSWETYDYDDQGQLTKVISSWKDVSLADASDSNARLRAYSYTPVDSRDVLPVLDGQTQYDGRPRMTTESVEGTVVGRTWHAYFQDAGGNDVEITERAANVNSTYGDAANLRTTKILNAKNGPALTAERVARIEKPDRTLELYTYSQSGNQITATILSGQPSPNGDVVIDGTQTVRTTDPGGNLISETVTDISSGLLVSFTQATSFDSFGRPTHIDYSDGTSETRVYNCCGLESQTDREGVTTSYLYDDLHRVISKTRAGITMLNTYDAEGRILSTIRKGTDNTEIHLSTLTYDVAGRQTSATDALQHTTLFSENLDFNGHLLKTTTFPNSGTSIKLFSRDGALLSINGTGVHPLKFEYGVEGDGLFAKQIRVGDGGSESEWSKTYTDFLGRSYKTVSSNGAIAQSFFNNLGQLVKQVDPDGVTTLLNYNPRGEQEVSAMDMDRNGTIDFSGTDRISKTSIQIVSAHGVTARRATTLVWTTDGADSPLVASVVDQSVDGLQSWSTAYGQTTHTETQYDGQGGRTIIVTVPDGTVTTQIYSNDRLVSSVQKSGSTTLSSMGQTYDAHGRLQSSTDARGLVTSYQYLDNDQVYSIQTDSQITTFTYDSMGRKQTVTMPDGGVVTNHYVLTGELADTSGARTYPANYVYDAQGRLKMMHAGTGTTTWNYDVAGLLTSKLYDDGKGPSYTYTPGSRLLTRKWARGITTTYHYNNAGELDLTAYNDNTPSITMTYDRRGRQITGSNLSYVYNDAGELLTETHHGDSLDGVTVSHTYDTLLRPSTLASSLNAQPLTSTSYGYDSASRLSSVSDGSRSAFYAYASNSSLIDTITFRNNGNMVMTTKKTYDILNRLTSISSLDAQSSIINSFSYQYNQANQRTRVDLADSSHWDYGYDNLGQVISGVKRVSDGTNVPGQQFGYNFDNIGNRTSAIVNSQNATYTANSLNQYTQRTVPGAVDVMGTAKPDATVTVNDQPVTRKGDYFYKQLSVTNSTSSVNQPVQVVGAKGNTGPNGEDGVMQQNGHVFVPKDPEQFTYDDDGNLLRDGRWMYGWDGENRLVSMQTLDNLVPSLTKQRLEFNYDSKGRRIQKKVFEWNPNLSTFELRDSTLFVFDAWNCVAELSSSTLKSSYVWGLDLSNSTNAAGGIGGLLFCSISQSDPSFMEAYAYDGNGNVTALMDTVSGKIVARYEYSPFGELIRDDNPGGILNPFKFSTKYTDAETDLLYYGYRFYNPTIGRWINRDLLGELGFELERQSVKQEARACGMPFGCKTRRSGNSIQLLQKSFILQARVGEAFPIPLIGSNNTGIIPGELTYVFALNDPIIHYDLLGLDCPACDVVGGVAIFQTPCALRCCAKHDQCYDANNCTAWSFATTYLKMELEASGIPVSYNACDRCNLDVLTCLQNCVQDVDPSGPMYYCRKQHRYITIGRGGDFANLKAAQKCCCSD